MEVGLRAKEQPSRWAVKQAENQKPYKARESLPEKGVEGQVISFDIPKTEPSALLHLQELK